MENLELKRMQQNAFNGVINRINDANNSSATTRLGELNSLHISAYMDINKTTESLNQILAYKKEVSIRLLKCENEEQMLQLSELIKHSDDMIKKILGITNN